MKSGLVAAFFILMGIVLSYPQKTIAIVGGRFAQIEEFPFFLRIKGCGVTKISRNLLLTAAHCVGFFPRQGFHSDRLVLSYGADRKSEKPFELKVTELFVHPEYFRNANTIGLVHDEFGPDIALLRVEPNSAFDLIPIARLKLTPFNLQQETVIIGYGSYVDKLMSLKESEAAARDYEDTKGIQSLKVAVTRIVALDSTFFGTADFDATGRSTRMAPGDSGSPALFSTEGEQYVIGVASFRDTGGGYCHFTRLDSISGWINDILNGQEMGLSKVNEPIKHTRFVGTLVDTLNELIPELEEGHLVNFECTANWLINRDFEPEMQSYKGSCHIGNDAQSVQRKLSYQLMERLRNAGLIGKGGKGYEWSAYTGKVAAKCADRKIANVQRRACVIVSLDETVPSASDFLKDLP